MLSDLQARISLSRSVMNRDVNCCEFTVTVNFMVTLMATGRGARTCLERLQDQSIQIDFYFSHLVA